MLPAAREPSRAFLLGQGASPAFERTFEINAKKALSPGPNILRVRPDSVQSQPGRPMNIARFLAIPWASFW